MLTTTTFLSPNNTRDVYVYRDIKRVLQASQLTNIQCETTCWLCTW